MTERRFTLSWTVEGQDTCLSLMGAGGLDFGGQRDGGTAGESSGRGDTCRRPQRTIGEGVH